MIIKEGIYKHYKGQLYKVIAVCKHSETLEDFVMYEALYDNSISKLWVRPISLFTDSVEIDGVVVPRFIFVK